MTFISCYNELNFVCEECFAININDNCGVITVSVGLTASTSYCLKVYDKFGNTYQQTVTTDVSGDFIVDTTELPDRLFNRHAGEIEMQLFADCSTDTRVTFIQDSMTYSCILATISGGDYNNDFNNDFFI